MEASDVLSLISEKILPQAADPHLLAYCPSMELLALGSKEQQVLIYRLNGQRVYGATQKGTALTVDMICWKPNGQLLGIAWSDGIVRLVGAESSKTVHQIATNPEISGITWLGWASNFTRQSAAVDVKEARSWCDFVKELPDFDKEALDLPRDLSLIDIEASLPKLSIIPAGATSEDIFSTRASIDGLFRAFDPKDIESVDVMVVGTDDGRIHLSIYDSFVIGSFPVPLTTHQLRGNSYALRSHASNKFYSTHALLIGPATAKNQSSLYFVPLDLRFVSTSNEYLSLVAAKSTALHNLLRYIDQVQILMSVEWEATQDLPRKFLGNINETLADKGGVGISQVLYHTVVTGHAIPAVKEWLVDELAERGHKRWDKAVTTGLENLRKLVHEDMLPALERCSVILSRLRGIAKFQSSDETMGFSSHQIGLVMDTVTCLNLLCAKILAYTVEELDLFASFSVWLRFEIDRLASDSSSSLNDDIADKEAMMDHSKVLLYIQKFLSNSRLGAFFKNPDAKNEKEDSLKDSRDGQALFEAVDKALRANDISFSPGTLTRLDILCKHLDAQATAVFQQIAEAEKRNVLFGKPIDLGPESPGTKKIVRICPLDGDSCKVFIAMASESTISLFAITMKIENGISSQTSLAKSSHDLGSSTLVLDIASADDNRLAILCETKDSTPKPHLLILRFEAFFPPITTTSTPSKLKPSSSTSPPLISHQQPLTPSLLQKYTYVFPVGTPATFHPGSMTISEFDGTIRGGVSGSRICIVDKSLLQYRIFTLVEKDVVGRGERAAPGADSEDGDGVEDNEDEDEDIQMTQ